MLRLSYQTAEESCWVTCMINGIRHITKEETIPTRAYRLLHSMLQDDGVHYYKPWELLQLDSVLSEVASLTKLKLWHRRKDQVAGEVEGLCFARLAAVCDIGHGEHSILLTRRKGDWFSAFDPWWYGPDRREVAKKLRSPKCFPKNDIATNMRINKSHLLGTGRGRGYGCGKDYQMGKTEKRFLTVIERP